MDSRASSASGQPSEFNAEITTAASFLADTFHPSQVLEEEPAEEHDDDSAERQAAADKRRASAGARLAALRDQRQRSERPWSAPAVRVPAVCEEAPRAPATPAATERRSNIRSLASSLMRRITSTGSERAQETEAAEDEAVTCTVPKGADASIDFMSFPDLMVQRLDLVATLPAPCSGVLRTPRRRCASADALRTARARRRLWRLPANAAKRTQLLAEFERLEAEVTEWRFSPLQRRSTPIAGRVRKQLRSHATSDGETASDSSPPRPAADSPAIVSPWSDASWNSGVGRTPQHAPRGALRHRTSPLHAVGEPTPSAFKTPPQRREAVRQQLQQLRGSFGGSAERKSEALKRRPRTTGGQRGSVSRSSSASSAWPSSSGGGEGAPRGRPGLQGPGHGSLRQAREGIKELMC